MREITFREGLELIKNTCRTTECSAGNCKLKDFCNEYLLRAPLIWEIDKIVEQVENVNKEKQNDTGTDK